MLRSRSSNVECLFDDVDLLQIGSRCQELKKEKDMLKETQSQSFELIRKLEMHVKSLSEAHKEDKKRVEKLENELKNCTRERDYLQGQLNARNKELNCLLDHIHMLELKLGDMDNLREKIWRLEEELRRSNSESFFLMQELENKEVEIQKSTLCIEKLEESISSMSLESQCEIESMKLDMMTLEQSCFEAKKIQEEAVLEKERIRGLLQELENEFQNAKKTIESLDRENKELREKSDASERNASIFCKRIEKLLEFVDASQLTSGSFPDEQGWKLTSSNEVSCVDLLGPLLPKLEKALSSDADFKGKMELVLHQIEEYELLVKQLKDELRQEKLKAKEEAEDLAQEMAELRFQITGLLEEERKRRVYIEHASLQRISQLEAEVRKGQGIPLGLIQHPHES